jgi:hypothetical protein
MSDLWAYAASERLTRSGGRIDQLISGLSFTGGACLGMIPFLALTGSRRGWIVWALLTLGAITLAVTVDPFPHHHIRTVAGVQWSMLAQLCLFVGAGIATLMAAASETRRGRDGWLLVLWIFGTFIFAAFCNWTVNGRSLLPLVPAVAIVVIRRYERTRASARTWALWLVLPAVALSLLCATADSARANTTRDAAGRIAARAGQFDTRLLINGHWGFQYYLMQAGGIPCDAHGGDLYRDDIVATAFNNTNLLPTNFDPDTFERIGHLDVVPFPFLTTMSEHANAGFYAGSWGPLPYAFGPAPAERYQLIMLTDPSLPVRRQRP